MRWTVIGVSPEDPRRVLARCACGTERTVLAQNIKHGRSQSCGCLTAEAAAGEGEWSWFKWLATSTLDAALGSDKGDQ